MAAWFCARFNDVTSPHVWATIRRIMDVYPNRKKWEGQQPSLTSLPPLGPLFAHRLPFPVLHPPSNNLTPPFPVHDPFDPHFHI